MATTIIEVEETLAVFMTKRVILDKRLDTVETRERLRRLLTLQGPKYDTEIAATIRDDAELDTEIDKVIDPRQIDAREI